MCVRTFTKFGVATFADSEPVDPEAGMLILLPGFSAFKIRNSANQLILIAANVKDILSETHYVSAAEESSKIWGD